MSREDYIAILAKMILSATSCHFCEEWMREDVTELYTKLTAINPEA